MRIRPTLPLLALLLLPVAAHAQTAPQVDLPYGGSTLRTDALALRTNPANLAWLQGFHTSFLIGRASESEEVDQIGWFTGFGSGRGFGLAIAGEWIEIPEPVRVLTTGVGIGGPRVAVGLSSRMFSSDTNPGWDGMHLLDAGATIRATGWLGFSVVAHGLNRPALTPNGTRRPLELETGFALRTPMGRAALDASWTTIPEDRERSFLTGTVVTRLWRGIQVYGATELGLLQDDMPWQVHAGFGLTAGPAAVSLTGAIHPDGASPGIIATFEASSPFPFQDYRGGTLYRVRLAGDFRERPGPAFFQGGGPVFTDLLVQLDAVARDERMDGVFVQLEGVTAGPAQIWELRAALERIRDADKHVLVYLADAGIKDLVLASTGTHVMASPDVSVLDTGIGVTGTYFGDLLEELGVEAQFVRIGDFKSAPERFTGDGPSEASQQQLDAYLDAVWGAWTASLAVLLGVDADELNEVLQDSPLLASALESRGAVDAVLWPDELGAHLEDYLGGRVRLTDTRLGGAERDPWWSHPFDVAVIHISGGIVSGVSGQGLLSGDPSTGSGTVEDVCRDILSDTSIEGVIVRIDSPGGDAVASAAMWRALQLLSAEVPVVVSMGDAAASGGYYAAAFGTTIHATPVTLTGSIGIFAGTFGLDGLLGALGVERVRTERGGPSSFFDGRRWDADREAAVLRSITASYEQFLERVAEGRSMTTEAVDAVGQGRIWSGAEAQRQGLVDELDGFIGAVDQLRDSLGVSDSIEVRLHHRGLAQPGGLRLMQAAVQAVVGGNDAGDVVTTLLQHSSWGELLPWFDAWIAQEPGSSLALLEYHIQL